MATIPAKKKQKMETESSNLDLSTPHDVECDVCTGTKLKAVSCCLECDVSFCGGHCKAHNGLFPGQNHKMLDIGQAQKRTCPQHKKPMVLFCQTDKTFVCFLCTEYEHKGHITTSISKEREKKQTQLLEKQGRFQQRIQEREKELQELRKAMETLKSSAQTAVEDITCILTKMKELIKTQEKKVSQTEGFLQQEIAELKRRDAELEQLSHTDDHIHFLKTVQSVIELPEPKDISTISAIQIVSFEAVRKYLSTLKGQLENLCKAKAVGTEVQAVLPTTRDEFLKYLHPFTLDPNTVYKHLHLSEGNRRVERRDQDQSYPDCPERFDAHPQVLCREGVSERCYWEVEWSGESVGVVASYKTISRKTGGNKCRFGYNDRSWRLTVTSGSSAFRHNNIGTELPLVASSRIGVYVDLTAGTLSFYSVSDTMTLLHRVQTKFTETLYPAFGLGKGSKVQLTHPGN